MNLNAEQIKDIPETALSLSKARDDYFAALDALKTATALVAKTREAFNITLRKYTSV